MTGFFFFLFLQTYGATHTHSHDTLNSQMIFVIKICCKWFFPCKLLGNFYMTELTVWHLKIDFITVLNLHYCFTFVEGQIDSCLSTSQCKLTQLKLELCLPIPFSVLGHPRHHGYLLRQNFKSQSDISNTVNVNDDNIMEGHNMGERGREWVSLSLIS